MASEFAFTSKRNKVLNYLLAFLAIALGGIHFFSASTPMKLGISLLLISIFIFKQKKIDQSFLWITALFLSIIFIQHQVFSANITLKNYISYILYYVAPSYLILKIIGDTAPRYIVNILVVYAIISLIFWGLSNIFEPFHSFTSLIAPRLGTDPISEVSEQFIVYTYEQGKEYGIIRNPGPFNEPGTFALFLIWGLVMRIIQNKGHLDSKSKILIITILTTMSTAVYLSLFVLISYYVFSKKVKGIFKLLFIIFLIPVLYYSYKELDFLGDKIDDQFEYQTNVSINTPTSGRFLGARKSLYVLQKYPLYGRGLLSATKVNDPSSAEDASYGILAQAAQMGLIGITAYLVLFWKGIKFYVNKYQFSKRFISFAFVALMISLLSQNRTVTPLFMILVFSSLIFRKKHSIHTNNIKRST